MNKWHKTIDVNKLSIHILSAYQLAKNMIADENSEYSMFTSIQYGKGTFYICSRRHKCLTLANKKLSQHLMMLTKPIITTEIRTQNDSIYINGHFLIVDYAEFEIITISNPSTPIKINIIGHLGCHRTS